MSFFDKSVAEVVVDDDKLNSSLREVLSSLLSEGDIYSKMIKSDNLEDDTNSTLSVYHVVNEICNN